MKEGERRELRHLSKFNQWLKDKMLKIVLYEITIIYSFSIIITYIILHVEQNTMHFWYNL